MFHVKQGVKKPPVGGLVWVAWVYCQLGSVSMEAILKEEFIEFLYLFSNCQKAQFAFVAGVIISVGTFIFGSLITASFEFSGSMQIAQQQIRYVFFYLFIFVSVCFLYKTCALTYKICQKYKDKVY